MTRLASLVRALARDTSGAMAIETAFIVPILATICLGGFEASQLVARNTELQTALAEAAAVSLARQPQTQGEIDTIIGIVAVSTGLDEDPAEGEIVMVRKYRCAVEDELRDSDAAYDPNEPISSYLQLTLNDSYDPIWTSFGIGSTVEFSKTRMLQIS